MRLFVAADPPEDLREAIESRVVAPLREALPGARWTRPEGRHLTLKFLGNVADDGVGAVSSAVRTAAAAHTPFEAAFADLGAFPSTRRPRVLWIGVGHGAAEFAAIARSLEHALEPLHFVPEDRPFRCHLTLARFAKPRGVEISPVAVPTGVFRVGEVVLFRSHLHPKGARYEALERFPLGVR
jgi:2'-5' RNA ligase